MLRQREAETKKRLMNRMQRISGQTRGILRMIEEGRYCIDILNQISAVQGALDRVALAILEDHTRHCLRHSLEKGGERQAEAIEEMLAVLRKML